jgi:hypothetical protein
MQEEEGTGAVACAMRGWFSHGLHCVAGQCFAWSILLM